VKPDNIFLVGEPGDPYAVKVLDFGLAKLDAQSGFTSAGIAIGTLEYMAPEQVVSDGSDARTDVYGFGVVMFRMFTGQLPFHANEEAELLAHQLILPVPPPSRKKRGLDQGIEAVILKATRKRPENRYSSLEEMLDDIERLMGDRGGTLDAIKPSAMTDVYEPRGAFAKNAAAFLYRKLGMDVPTF
jgi:serine/threonine-protein kinase